MAPAMARRADRSAGAGGKGQMSATDAILRVNDQNLSELLAAERAVLILTERDCGHCADYLAQIAAFRARGALDGVAIGALALDQPGSPRFKRENYWLGRLAAPPYTVLYSRGEPVGGFAASRGAYLLERVDEALPAESRAA
jgi:hypothetical protein